MAERDRLDRLNDAIDAIIARRPVSVDPELATILMIAADLRDLPDPRFRARLRSELIQKEDESMTVATAVNNVRPYLFVDGADPMIEFLRQTFGAEVLMRVEKPDGKLMHAEVRIGDTVIEMGDAGEVWTSMKVPLHIYIEDVDETYARALAAGAKSLSPPVVQPYGDREAGIVDPFGGEWFLATHLEKGPRPAGFGTVTPYLRVSGAPRLIDFLRNAFGAEELSRTADPSGVIRHAELKIAGSMLELSDAHGQWGPVKGAFHVMVDDCDATYRDALAAGGTSMFEPEDKPYGERQATVSDEFGNLWFIATPL